MWKLQRGRSERSRRTGRESAKTVEAARAHEDLEVALARDLAAAGIAAGARLGRSTGPSPRVLRGVDSQGRDVVVHIVDLPDGRAGATLLSRLADLRTLRHPCLARVLEVVVLPGSRAAVTVDLVDGVDLAVVLGARGGLTRSEGARLMDDVASALAGLHEAGLAHGDVSTSNIMVTTDGGAVLIDLVASVMETGTPPWAAPERSAGGPATAASDVYSLAALLRSCASHASPLEEALEAVLVDALSPDPDARPTARALGARTPQVGRPGVIELPDGARMAAGALRAAALVPTRVVPSRLAGRPATGRRWLARLVRVGLTAALVAGLVAGGYAAAGALGVRGSAAGGRGSASPTVARAAASAPYRPSSTASVETLPSPASADAPTEQEVREAVIALSASRDAALLAGDRQALAATTLEGSPAAQADEALWAQLSDAGETIESLRTTIQDVRLVDLPDQVQGLEGAVAVEVTRVQEPSTRQGPEGERTVPAQGPYRMILVLVPGPWRVAQVHPAS